MRRENPLPNFKGIQQVPELMGAITNDFVNVITLHARILRMVANQRLRPSVWFHFIAEPRPMLLL